MSTHTPHIVGLGNALVDVVATVEGKVVERHGLTPGGMHLVDAASAGALIQEVGPGVRQSGGSVANTLAHVAGLGLGGTYLGKVSADDLGRVFRDEFGGMDIAMPVADVPAGGVGTGHCVSLVTDDGERTMSTFLGAAETLSPEDIADAMPGAFDVLFVEGYRWDAPQGHEGIVLAAERARAAGAKIAVTPADAGCVDRNRDAMLAFVSDWADILIGNHQELAALSGTDEVDAQIDWALARVGTVAVTVDEQGSWVADATGRHRVPAVSIAKVVDSTGAGDAYAAGFLGGLARGETAVEAGRQGAELAAKVLGHYGAREGDAARALGQSAA